MNAIMVENASFWEDIKVKNMTELYYFVINSPEFTELGLLEKSDLSQNELKLLERSKKSSNRINI